MKSYSLIPNSKLKARYRYIESDTSIENKAIDQLKLQTFEIDWDKIQKEMNVEIPTEVRMKYQKAYNERSFSIAEMLGKIRDRIAYMGFLGTLVSGLLKLFIVNHIIFYIAVSVVVILMLSRAIYTSTHKLKELDPKVINRIANQMLANNLNINEVKHVWGESYRYVANVYVDSPWHAFFIQLLGMSAMSFVGSLAMSKVTTLY